ncbi:MAG: 4-hydroxy-tetrahydrodipicolinate reductase [Betaproteobacteria bacterium]|nr:4-hydroxy-tetrahydrodipicolinate reductase [Betaproteobacteria bacterium]MDH5222728.1 4-hydroxy-tetrahydrodipicolinate reductase [Betaproteobacteria bacterium]MDH5352289.1 4-hydroxy-tetrahydrodipicolinate reductase [Betaproteobacteria bacterium]
MKVAIAGAGGRMGRALIDALQAERDLTLAAALDAAGSPAIGQTAGGSRIVADLGALAEADVLIDFTRPEGTMAHLEACLAQRRAMVIGTTGFSDAQKARIAEGARRIPIAWSPNFAIGVNVVFRLAQTAARALGDAYDVEIVEAHHRHKVDAPSGTALKLGELVAGALGRNLGEVATHGRAGDIGERPAKAIGFHAIRGGDIVGEHTVIFAGAGERVEITVRSHSRQTYAAGALRAARWLGGRAPGLYDMFDVLGLK